MAKKLANLIRNFVSAETIQGETESIFDCLGDKDRMVECLQELDTRIGQVDFDTGIPQEIIDRPSVSRL